MGQLCRQTTYTMQLHLLTANCLLCQYKSETASATILENNQTKILQWFELTIPSSLKTPRHVSNVQFTYKMIQRLYLHFFHQNNCKWLFYQSVGSASKLVFKYTLSQEKLRNSRTPEKKRMSESLWTNQKLGSIIHQPEWRGWLSESEVKETCVWVMDSEWISGS